MTEKALELSTTPLPYRDASISIEARIQDLIQRMTLEEKICQLSIASNAHHEPLDEEGRFDERKAAEWWKEGVGEVGRLGIQRSARETASYYNAMQKFLVENTRLGIPAMVCDELLHGLMALGGTSFPQAIALGSTWDPNLIRELFSAAAAEARARGTHHALSPVLDLARDPRWGRTEETYGEDPYLVSCMGAACIRGLQGPDGCVDGQHVLATAKHFAAHGQPESGTNCGPANYAERDLREYFLVPFKTAITEAQARSVMASYNEINGIPVHANPWILKDILRQEWHFTGFVVSDGHGIEMLQTVHHVAATRAEAARLALEAGIDTELDECYPTLVEQVRQGLVDEAMIDRSLTRFLQAKFSLGLFDDPYVDPDLAERVNNCPEHRRLALKAAQEALVLLKNEGGLLPLDPEKVKTLAVIGPNAADIHLGGYSIDPGNSISVLQGIRDRVEKTCRVDYAEGCRISEGDRDWRGWWTDDVTLPDPQGEVERIAEAVKIAEKADVVLLVIGENEGTCREGWSKAHLGDRDSLDLLGNQDEMVKAVLATGKPVIVLLINGRPLSIHEIADRVPAILEGWYLGQEGGTAVAQVLFGDVNPGGKLPITFPRSVGMIPAFYNHKPSARRGYIFANNEPLFPFGHGLSYTSFVFTGLRLSSNRIRVGETTRVSVEVSNIGKRAGDEVVQFYLHDLVSSVTRPVKELKGFQRISLEPGETRTVEFLVGPEEMSFLGKDMKPIIEPGWFEIMVGSSSVKYETIQVEVVEEQP